MSGCCNGSDFYRLAVKRFIELADEASEKRAKRDPLDCLPIIPDVSWLVREQSRYWRISLLATQKASSFWLTNLKYLFRPERGVGRNWCSEPCCIHHRAADPRAKQSARGTPRRGAPPNGVARIHALPCELAFLLSHRTAAHSGNGDQRLRLVVIHRGSHERTYRL